MKLVFSKIISLVILMLCGCTEESPKSNFEDVMGIWTTYEIILDDGTVNANITSATTVFGVYASGIHLKQDRTYVPIVWNSPGNFLIKDTEAGAVSLISDNKRLTLTGGSWEMDFEIIKQTRDTLGLKSRDGVMMPGNVYNAKYFMVRKE